MVYTDEEMPLFEKYKIVAIPTQVFFDASGKVVDQHIGALPKEEVHQETQGIEVHPLIEETIHGME